MRDAPALGARHLAPEPGRGGEFRSRSQLALSYRHSCFMEEGMQGSCIVTGAAFGLAKGREGRPSTSEMDGILNQRRKAEAAAWNTPARAAPSSVRREPLRRS